MSEKLRKAVFPASAPEANPRGDELEEQVEGLLGDIEEVLSVPPPPLTGWSSIPPERRDEDPLAELAAELAAAREESPRDALAASRRHGQPAPSASVIVPAAPAAPNIALPMVEEPSTVDSPNISVTSVTFDANDGWDEEPTHDWGAPPPGSASSASPERAAPPDGSHAAPPVPPPPRSAAFLTTPDYLVAERPAERLTPLPLTPDYRVSAPGLDELDDVRAEMPSLVDTIDDTPGTLRPSAVSLPAARPPRRRSRVPRSLWLGAAAAVAAAVVAYRTGPYAAGDQAEAARHVAAVTTPADGPRLTVRDRDGAHDLAAEPGDTQRLLVTVMPSNAFLSLRPIDEREGKRSAGPWPKAFDLVPGEYELVAFRNGFKPLLRRVTVRPGVRPAALELRLVSEDIYE